MKLYDSIGPNPHVVRMVVAEKGLDIPKVRVNLRDGENRQAAYRATVNPMGQVPALELDDGSILTEITAIAEYLDELHPEPPLLGRTALERARTRMWVRRLDLNVAEPMTSGYRNGEGLDFFKDRLRCIPEASAGQKANARDCLAWLEGEMAGRSYIVDDRFSLADILLFCFTRFAAKVGQPFDPAWTNLATWQAGITARPSAKS